MEMCPTCNEPAASTELRVDWTNEKLRKPGACRGDHGDRGTGNVGSIEVFHGQPEFGDIAAPVGAPGDRAEVATPTSGDEGGRLPDVRSEGPGQLVGPGSGAVEVSVSADALDSRDAADSIDAVDAVDLATVDDNRGRGE